MAPLRNCTHSLERSKAELPPIRRSHCSGTSTSALLVEPLRCSAPQVVRSLGKKKYTLRCRAPQAVRRLGKKGTPYGTKLLEWLGASGKKKVHPLRYRAPQMVRSLGEKKKVHGSYVRYRAPQVVRSLGKKKVHLYRSMHQTQLHVPGEVALPVSPPQNIPDNVPNILRFSIPFQGRGLTPATIEARHVFSEVPCVRSLRHVLLNPKTDTEKSTTATYDPG